MTRFRRRVARALILSITFLLISPQSSTRAQNTTPPYKNPSLPVEKRVDDLISRMTLEEKVSQMMNAASADRKSVV